MSVNLMLGLLGDSPPSFPSASGLPSFVILFIVFVGVMVVGSLLVTAGRGVAEWSANNQSPVLTVPAKVVSRREDVSSYVRSGNSPGIGSRSSTTTEYYATFELESGDRREFEIEDDEYGVLAEGDMGSLTFQGTRYQGFQRERTGTSPRRSALAEAPFDPEPPRLGVAGEKPYCPHCGVPVSGEYSFCPQCGQPQPKKNAFH